MVVAVGWPNLWPVPQPMHAIWEPAMLTSLKAHMQATSVQSSSAGNLVCR